MTEHPEFDSYVLWCVLDFLDDCTKILIAYLILYTLGTLIR